MVATLLLTDSLADSLSTAVARGVPIETAVAAAGVSEQQFYAWLRAAESGLWPGNTPVAPRTLESIKVFAEKIRRAQAEYEADCITRISEAGRMVGKSGVPEWRALAWIANNHPRYRERYRPQRETLVEHKGTVLHEHTLAEKLSDTEVLEAYEALKALPEPQGSENSTFSDISQDAQA